MTPDEIDEILLSAKTALDSGNPQSSLKILEKLRVDLLKLRGEGLLLIFSDYSYELVKVLEPMATISIVLGQHNKGHEYLLEAEEICNKRLMFMFNSLELDKENFNLEKIDIESIDHEVVWHWVSIQSPLANAELILGKPEEAKSRLQCAENVCRLFYEYHSNKENNKESNPYIIHLAIITHTEGIIFSSDPSLSTKNAKNYQQSLEIADACFSESLAFCNIILKNNAFKDFHESIARIRVETLSILSKLSYEFGRGKDGWQRLNETKEALNNLSKDAIDIFLQIRTLQSECDTYISVVGRTYERLNFDKSLASVDTFEQIIELMNKAIEANNKIDELINGLISDKRINNSAILTAHIIASKVSRAKIILLDGKPKKARDILIPILNDIENTIFYPTGLIPVLIQISNLYKLMFFGDPKQLIVYMNLNINPVFKPVERFIKNVFTKKFSTEINNVFNRTSALLLKWYEFQATEIPKSVSESLKEFWQTWVELALGRNDSTLLTNILTTHHARRQIAMLNLNWVTANNLDSDIQQFVDLRKRRHELELQLLPFQQNLTAETAQRYQDLMDEYATAHQQCQESRDALIATGRYPDWTKSRTDIAQLQADLNTGEALLLTMSFQDLGFQDKAPVLLLLRRDSIDWIDSPEIAAAAQTMLIIHKLQTTQGRNLPLRKNTTEFNNDDITESSPEVLAANFDQLQKEMQAFWQAESLRSKLANVAHLTIIGHGSLHALPFQYYCPVKKNACYPSLHVYWQRQQNRHASIPVPCDESPLFILANAAEDDPVNRLYYLPVEIAVITQIWGASTVRVIDDLKDFRSGHLSVLGHGNFDKKSGQARFTMKDRELEAHELLTLKKTILTLGASACLLGQAIDIADAEPMGLFALAGNRNDIRFNYGAILPVDDLKCCFLSCLFHYYWKKTGSPYEGMRLAINALTTGKWENEAQDVFINVLAKQLPGIFMAMRDDEKKHPNLREHLQDIYYNLWLDNRRSNILLKTTMIDDKKNDQARHTAAVELAKDFFARRMTKSDEYSLDFAPYWLYG